MKSIQEGITTKDSIFQGMISFSRLYKKSGKPSRENFRVRYAETVT